MEEEFKEKYKKFLKENPNITKYIDYIGEIEDRKELENYYKKSSVFCLTSRYESFGLVLVEAMSYGCYIVTTDFGFVAHDIVKNKKIGEICPIDNKNMLAKKISEYENRKDSFMSERITFAKENFDWNKIVELIEKYLKNKTIIKNNKKQMKEESKTFF